MTSLVFTRTDGTLDRINVNFADLVTLSTATYSAWGYLGGLQPIRGLVGYIKNTTNRDPWKDMHLNPKYATRNSRFQVLTSMGRLSVEDENGDEAFGGTRLTQAIGLTLCALAHECDPTVAVDLFVKFMAKKFLELCDDIPELVEALYQLLLDKATLIINEGVTRGLPERFLAAADELPQPAKHWQFKPPKGDQQLINFELSLVGALLDWVTTYIARGHSDTHYTRSSLVLRTAAYLRTVGYNIGPTVVWEGEGEPPTPPSGVVLVMKGVMETDFMPTPNVRVPYSTSSIKFFYRLTTVGSMLVNALRVRVEVAPEAAQNTFDRVRGIIKERIQLRWTSVPHTVSRNNVPGIKAEFDYDDNPEPGDRFCSSLASMHFQLNSNLFQSCYDPIATEKALKTVKSHKDRELDNIYGEEDLKTLSRIRIITASIVICLAELMVADFEATIHLTRMHLSSSTWIYEACSMLDKGIQSGCDYHDAVAIVGAVHCGRQSIKLPGDPSSTLGFRYGGFAVLPAILANMRPEEEAIGLTCYDRFIANVPVFPDGSVHETTLKASSPDESTAELSPQQQRSAREFELLNLHKLPGISSAMRTVAVQSTATTNMRKTLHGLAPHVKQLVGCFQDRVVFLDHQYWLCTWEMELTYSKHKRHFFLPKDWVSPTALQMLGLNRKGVLLCPRNGEVAIVRSEFR
ncbi:hypothetical protein PG985_012773 [Apiospora marii]|uniref:Anaphase-promoting complex subunit 1 n=1 Tax=Apiospora marii TaxID=335849 RepID=A0ABR1RCA2_9PEZI